MSHAAIAAALALEDLSVSERLVAFSLASFADRANLAHPGTTAAMARAGLGKSGFLEARNGLLRRGLVAVVRPATGRGRASTLGLPFADAGPWWEGDVNVALFEAVLGYSRARASARLLIAAMAAIADERGVVEGLKTDELSTAAGITERTYGRVRGPLVASGELVLRTAARGRGNRNCWEIPDPRAGGVGDARVGRRRVTPPADARPLIASLSAPDAVDEERGDAVADEAAGGGRERRAADAGKGGQDWTLFSEKGPDLSGVPDGKRCQDRTLSTANGPDASGFSIQKGGQARTLSRGNPAENPAENPAPNARACRESQNPRTNPPNPPQGGAADSIVVEETYVSERGRRRTRPVIVDLAEVRSRFRAAGKEDRAAWEQIRELLLEAVGESTFAIWLDPLQLVAVDPDATLVVAVPEPTRGWVRARFARVLASAAERVGGTLRFATDVERRAFAPPPPAVERPSRPAAPAGSPGGESPTRSVSARSGRAVGPQTERSSDRGADRSAYPSSYTDVYTQTKEVS